MKKSITIFTLLFILISCGQEKIQENNQNIVEKSTQKETVTQSGKSELQAEKIEKEEKIEKRIATVFDEIGLKIFSPSEWGEVIQYNTFIIGESEIGTFYFDKIGKKGTNFGEILLDGINFKISFWSYENVIQHNNSIGKYGDLGGVTFDTNTVFHTHDSIKEGVCNFGGRCYWGKDISVGYKKIYRVGEVSSYGGAGSSINYIYITGDKNIYLTANTLYYDSKNVKAGKILDEKIVTKKIFDARLGKQTNFTFDELNITEEDFSALDTAAINFFSKVDFEDTLTKSDKLEKEKIIQKQIDEAKVVGK